MPPTRMIRRTIGSIIQHKQGNTVFDCFASGRHKTVPCAPKEGPRPPKTPNSNQRTPWAKDRGAGPKGGPGPNGPTYLITIGWLTHVNPTATSIFIRPPRVPNGREASHDSLEKSLPSKGRLPYKPNAHAPTGK